MALRDQRHPISTGAEGVELLESEADDLETTVPAALADEMALVRVGLGGPPLDLIVRDPQELLVLIHPTFCHPGALGSLSRRRRWVPGSNGWALLEKGQVLSHCCIYRDGGRAAFQGRWVAAHPPTRRRRSP